MNRRLHTLLNVYFTINPFDHCENACLFRRCRFDLLKSFFTVGFIIVIVRFYAQSVFRSITQACFLLGTARKKYLVARAAGPGRVASLVALNDLCEALVLLALECKQRHRQLLLPTHGGSAGLLHLGVLRLELCFDTERR